MTNFLMPGLPLQRVLDKTGTPQSGKFNSIETAPKGGRFVVLWKKYWEFPSIAKWEWWNNNNHEEGGYWQSENCCNVEDATHWFELPNFPD